MFQGEFKSNVAAVTAGMTYSSLRESRSRLCENYVGVTTVRGLGWNDPMTVVVPRVKGFLYESAILIGRKQSLEAVRIESNVTIY